MTHRPIEEDDLQFFVDDALDPARREEVLAFLSAHADIAARVDAYRRQRAALREALAPIAEEPVPTELSLRHLSPPAMRPGPSWLQAIAAGVLLAMLGGGGGWALRGALAPSGMGVAALVQDAADSYRVFAPDKARPVEIRATQQAELVTWVSRRLGRAMQVPDLSEAGFHFIGGRLIATRQGPAALFMFDDAQGTRLAMVAQPALQGDAPPDILVRHASGQLNGLSWGQQGVDYILLGPTPQETLSSAASAARHQL